MGQAKIGKENEPGDEYQAGVVKKIIGSQQEKKRAKGSGHAPQDARYAEMRWTRPKSMNAHDGEMAPTALRAVAKPFSPSNQFLQPVSTCLA